MSLRSSIVVSGLLRAAETAGGNGAVLSRGDADAGAILLVLASRGKGHGVWERMSRLDGVFTWNLTKDAAESGENDSVARFIDDRKRFDRDIWAVELDIPNVEQFIVDSLTET